MSEDFHQTWIWSQHNRLTHFLLTIIGRDIDAIAWMSFSFSALLNYRLVHIEKPTFKSTSNISSRPRPWQGMHSLFPLYHRSNSSPLLASCYMHTKKVCHSIHTSLRYMIGHDHTRSESCDLAPVIKFARNLPLFSRLTVSQVPCVSKNNNQNCQNTQSLTEKTVINVNPKLAQSTRYGKGTSCWRTLHENAVIPELGIQSENDSILFSS